MTNTMYSHQMSIQKFDRTDLCKVDPFVTYTHGPHTNEHTQNTGERVFFNEDGEMEGIP